MKRFELKGNESFTDFVLNNNDVFWEIVIDTIEKSQLTVGVKEFEVLTLHGGSLKSDLNFVITSDSMVDTITSAIKYLEQNENYEKCASLMKVKRVWEQR